MSHQHSSTKYVRQSMPESRRQSSPESDQVDMDPAAEEMTYFRSIKCGPGNWPPPDLHVVPRKNFIEWRPLYNKCMAAESFYSKHPEMRFADQKTPEDKSRLFNAFKKHHGSAADEFPMDIIGVNIILNAPEEAKTKLKSWGLVRTMSRKLNRFDVAKHEAQILAAYEQLCTDNDMMPIKAGEDPLPKFLNEAIQPEALEPKVPVVAKVGGIPCVTAYNNGFAAGFNSQLQFSNTLGAQMVAASKMGEAWRTKNENLELKNRSLKLRNQNLAAEVEKLHAFARTVKWKMGREVLADHSPDIEDGENGDDSSTNNGDGNNASADADHSEEREQYNRGNLDENADLFDSFGHNDHGMDFTDIDQTAAGRGNIGEGFEAPSVGKDMDWSAPAPAQDFEGPSVGNDMDWSAPAAAQDFGGIYKGVAPGQGLKDVNFGTPEQATSKVAETTPRKQPRVTLRMPATPEKPTPKKRISKRRQDATPEKPEPKRRQVAPPQEPRSGRDQINYPQASRTSQHISSPQNGQHHTSSPNHQEPNRENRRQTVEEASMWRALVNDPEVSSNGRGIEKNHSEVAQNRAQQNVINSSPPSIRGSVAQNRVQQNTITSSPPSIRGSLAQNRVQQNVIASSPPSIRGSRVPFDWSIPADNIPSGIREATHPSQEQVNADENDEDLGAQLNSVIEPFLPQANANDKDLDAALPNSHLPLLSHSSDQKTQVTQNSTYLNANTANGPAGVYQSVVNSNNAQQGSYNDFDLSSIDPLLRNSDPRLNSNVNQEVQGTRNSVNLANPATKGLAGNQQVVHQNGIKQAPQNYIDPGLVNPGFRDIDFDMLPSPAAYQAANFGQYPSTSQYAGTQQATSFNPGQYQAAGVNSYGQYHGAGYGGYQAANYGQYPDSGPYYGEQHFGHSNPVQYQGSHNGHAQAIRNAQDPAQYARGPAASYAQQNPNVGFPQSSFVVYGGKQYPANEHGQAINPDGIPYIFNKQGQLGRYDEGADGEPWISVEFDYKRIAERNGAVAQGGAQVGVGVVHGAAADFNLKDPAVPGASQASAGDFQNPVQALVGVEDASHGQAGEADHAGQEFSNDFDLGDFLKDGQAAQDAAQTLALEVYDDSQALAGGAVSGEVPAGDVYDATLDFENEFAEMGDFSFMGEGFEL